jgi:uncharacterized membrane protein YtjA (UPF0391 family)
MLGWILVFFVLALIAGAFGFGIVSALAGVAKFFFFVFLTLFVVSYLYKFRNDPPIR